MQSPLGQWCLTSREGVTERESHLTHNGDPYWLVKPTPAAREKLVENGGFMPSSTVAGRIVQREQAAIAVAAAA